MRAPCAKSLYNSRILKCTPRAHRQFAVALRASAISFFASFEEIARHGTLSATLIRQDALILRLNNSTQSRYFAAAARTRIFLKFFLFVFFCESQLAAHGCFGNGKRCRRIPNEGTSQGSIANSCRSHNMQTAHENSPSESCQLPMCIVWQDVKRNN